MKYTCPKCGKPLEYSIEELAAAQYKVACGQCGSTLEIVGDYAYMAMSDGSLHLADDDPEQPADDCFARDPLYDAAVDYVITCNAITPVMLAHYFDIPIERAQEIMRQLEENGVVGPENGGAPRTILIPHNTNLPGGFLDKYDPDAPSAPPEFTKGMKTHSCSLNCSGCLMILVLVALAVALFVKMH